jgi:hypothetical protein
MSSMWINAGSKPNDLKLEMNFRSLAAIGEHGMLLLIA